MKEQDYLKYWILPELGCDAGTACYDYAAGNTPKVMPLDTSLFNDLDKGVEQYIACTSRLAHNNPRKFSLSASMRASSAFKRVWKGCPSSVRIKQDIEKLAFNMQLIVDAKGCVIPSLGNSSKRYDSNCKKSTNWGEKRAHSMKDAIEHWIYEDAIKCPAIIIKEAVLKYELIKKDDVKEEVKDEKKDIPQKVKM